ncbi:hypothetical protein GXP67_24135 [Rhodocytophaga rosea]|uniref:Uncharacterized protein n=1 Tax=Rhodocytophaga rosea TaxID=2704465 RepID=A0A6C0GN86_9BACT|nr:hypothetical protein [Rhodocytophaga rosea]QHT69511.1 hypothetical protein GXP67_24135 [Rhodocytophaga rosea]
MKADYLYLGDKYTLAELKHQPCLAIGVSNGKCIRGKNGSMLVQFKFGIICVVIGRPLRKTEG